MDINAIILRTINLLNLEKYSKKIEDQLTSENLILILIYILFTISLISIISYRAFIGKRNLIEKFNIFKISQLKLINTIYKDKIYYIFIIPVFLTIYLMLFIPITYDEAFTFVNFIDRGIFVSAAFYPAPNNHVFYSVISSIVNLFDFKNIIPFRILSIIFFILFLILSVKTFLKNSPYLKKHHYLLLAVLPLSLVFIYQSSLARGYSLLAFLTLINIYYLQKILKENGDKHLKTFSIFTSLTFYTIPSYFYCHVIFCFLILLFKKKSLIFLLKSNAIIFFFTTFLFFPVIIFQGYDFIFQNNLIDKIYYKEFFFYLIKIKTIIEDEIFGVSIFIILFFLILSFYFSTKIKKSKEFLGLFLIVVISLFLPYLTMAIAPGRSLNLVYLFGLIIIFLPAKIVTEKISKKNLIILCLSIQVMLSFNILRNMPVEKYSTNAEIYTIKILKNNKNYYFCSNYYDPLFLYYKIKNRVQINEIKLSKNEFCNIDNINGYDWVVIDKKRDLSQIKPDFEESFWNFYSK